MIARFGAIGATALLLALGAPLTCGFDKCPGINSANHKTNLYDFNYDSWVKKEDKSDLFIFGRCIQTNNGTTFKVDWKKANVKGYVRKDLPCQNEIPSLTKDEVVVRSDLHFGAKQEKIVAAFKDVKIQEQTKLEPLHSYVKMSIPRRDGEEITDDTKLRRVNAKFTSSVKEGKIEGKYEYIYSWGPPDEKDAPDDEIMLGWKSEAVIQAMKVSNLVKTPKLSIKPQTVALTADRPPVYTIVVVEFLAEDGKTAVGNASVAIYRPMPPKKDK